MSSGRGVAFTPSRRRMQNRGFIAQLGLWGWRVKKVSGDFTTMVAPNGTKLQVRSAHNHTGNAPETYDEALEAMGITWDEFVARGKDEADHTVGAVLRSMDMETYPEDARRMKEAVADAAAEMREEARRVEKARRDRRRAERKAAKAVTKREDTPVEAVAMNDDVIKTSGRGNADKAFRLILGHSGPISIAEIAESCDIGERAAGNAAYYLWQIGVVERVKRGFYQRKHQYSAHDVTIDVVSRNLDVMPDESRPDSPAKAPTPIRPEVAVTPTAERDEILDEILDRLLPYGFRGRHLSIIARWREETLAMMALIEEDMQ